jgi:uncharacterized protein
MSSTIDANVLLYASDSSSDRHDEAKRFLRSWASGPELVYVFWPTVMAYLRIATHPRIFKEPLPRSVAASNVASLVQLDHVQTGSESERFWELFQSTTSDVVVQGNLVPDAHLVTLMRQFGVAEIWTRDRDFLKFDAIRVRDPFA